MIKKLNLKNMKECDNSKIRISSNFILSVKSSNNVIVGPAGPGQTTNSA
jgi:hypothetical protein